MKLNKVLSLVVAIAMLFTMTTFAAFSDVKSDANYSEAVDVLSALKILDGYEDGSFKPDGKITRGEFSKVVAGAIGMAESAKANQSGGIFKDVAADLWSSGYIATAYQAGIVNGMGDGTFAPEAEVTYDQAVKMLVCALGYTPKATALGGYPTGYLMVANQEGVTVGTANAAGGASRATVAKLVFNALTVPMMDQTSFGTDAAFEAQADQSLLFTKLGVAKADVVIDELSLDKTDTDVTLDISDYDDVASNVKNGYTAGLETVKINGVNLKGLQGLMVSALIDVSDDSELKLIAVTKKAGKNKELVIDPKLFVSTTLATIATDGKVTSAGKLTYYKTSDDDNDSDERLGAVKIYRNLDKISGSNLSLSSKTLAGDVAYKFVDTDNNGDYDVVFVTNETSFVIGSVNTGSNKIFRDTSNSNAASTFTKASIQLDPEDDTVDWSLKDATGKDLTLADLKAGQVANVKTSVNSATFYEIVITDSTIEGTISEVYTENDKVGSGISTFYKIGDKSYEALGSVTFKPGDSINATLNNQDKIIMYSVSAGTRNYGVVVDTSATVSFGLTGQIQMMTNKGELVTLDLAKKINGSSSDYFASGILEGAADTQISGDFSKGELVAYELNSANEIKNITTVETGSVLGDSDLSFAQLSTTDLYNATSDRLGSNYVLDSSVIFAVEGTRTALDKDKISLSSKSALIDDKGFAGMAVVNGSKEILVVVLEDLLNQTKWDQYPMVITSKATVTVDGDTTIKLTGLVNDEETVLTVNADKYDTYKGVQVNSMILYTLNGAKEIIKLEALASFDNETYTNLVNNTTAGIRDNNKNEKTAGTKATITAAGAVSLDGVAIVNGYAIAGKVYEVKGKTVRVINDYAKTLAKYIVETKIIGTASKTGAIANDGEKVITEVKIGAVAVAPVTSYIRDYNTYKADGSIDLVDGLITDVTVNPNAIAYIYDTNKVKSTTIADLETDVATVDNKATSTAAFTALDNDDVVYLYNYDGDTYGIYIYDTTGDND